MEVCQVVWCGVNGRSDDVCASAVVCGVKKTNLIKMMTTFFLFRQILQKKQRADGRVEMNGERRQIGMYVSMYNRESRRGGGRQAKKNKNLK